MAVKAMAVKASHHALLVFGFLCWASRSSRASGFLRAVKAMPVKGSRRALFLVLCVCAERGGHLQPQDSRVP